MEKMKMETPDGTKKNIERIKALFPNVITEMKDEKGNLKEGIDFERLKQELSGDVVEGTERYDFTWVGKKAAILEAHTPIRKTLRPCIEESKDWETTENLYIEGDNLDVLKLLQESYLGKVKMIYIDPPYNTGNDFLYNDNFTMDKEEYEDQTESIDEEGHRLFRNTESNGRFHSDWCSMMYPR
ncbi:MAG TPA: site-specific DNA-methyltransferase, partial [Thermotogota bacterium]|nr:site-specific DNA-methyltransferase [Thermotogota bacterium]